MKHKHQDGAATKGSIKYSWRFFGVVFLLAFVCLGNRLGDRLLLEINSYSYTQRQLEAHILVREAMRGRLEVLPGEVISTQNWRSLLNSFKEDMLILAEIERYGWYKPAQQDVEVAKNDVLQNIGKSQSEFVRLGINNSMLANLISINIKIDIYRKNQGTTLENGKPTWLKKLEKKNFVRFYRGSSVYLPIFPRLQDLIP